MNFIAFKLSFNDFYSQDISNKIKAVKHRKAEKGDFIGNSAPYGYQKASNNKNKLVVNKKTASVVKKIFDLRLQGYGTPKIAKILNEDKIPTPAMYIKSKKYDGKIYKWNKTTIHRILTNPVYIGTMVGNKSYKQNHKVKKRIATPNDKRIYVENTHEPIVSKEIFQKVQKKLKEPIKCRDRENVHPLKKFIYCAECGYKATMKVSKRKVKSGEIHKHLYFICGRKSIDHHSCETGRMAARIITPIVQEEIKKECSKIVFSKGDITSLYEQAKELANTRKALLKKGISKNEKEIKKIEKKIEEIYSDKLEGIIKQEDFIRFYDSYQEKKENLRIEINNLQQDLEETEKYKTINYKQIKKIASECLNTDKLDEKLLSKLIDRIEYTKDRKIIIKFRFAEFR